MKKTLFFIILFLLPFSAHAASVTLSAPEEANIHSEFAVEVFLDTEGYSVNAVEGGILLPEGVSLKDVRYQGSVVSLWLEKPGERENGVVSFAGVIPAGYQASPDRNGKGNLFTLVFSVPREGEATFSFANPVAYLNDGEGTARPASKGSARVRIVASGAKETYGSSADAYPPETFVPEIVPGEPYGMTGDVLIFATQDKDSGVAGFDVGSSLVGFLPEVLVSWVSAESPYQLSEENLGKYLFVRARDAAGNARVAVLPPREPGLMSILMTWVLPAGIALALIGFILLLIRGRHRVSLK
ncbi:hypothetical protein K2X83_02530 [Patescibacteria group bacterium]|nr:hypothetical protein [Patescibacteria group bacterium]